MVFLENCLFDGKIISTYGDDNAKLVTEAQLKSGEVAYKLGEAWGQTIGSENHPVIGGTKVYYGYENCGTAGAYYSNTELSETKPSHSSYDGNGFCTFCGGYQPAAGSGTESDPYQIGNAGQLYWFADQVNGGNTSAWAELTANIVVNENVLNTAGTLNQGDYRAWTPIGNTSYKYAGTFDGKDFTVSGLYFNDSDTSYVGLFGYLDDGTVKNVGVVDSYLSGQDTVDYLEDSERCVMQEIVTGRYFVDLYQLENAMKAYSGVTDAEAYIVYGANNKLILTAEVTAEKETDLAGLKEYAAEKFKVSAQPSKLIVNGTEIS